MAVVDAVVDASIHQPQRRTSLADIVRDTGLSRATTHAIVAELVDLGWLQRDDSGTVTLGGGFLATATRALGSDRLTLAARPILARLADELGMPVFLARRIDEQAITVVEYGWPSSRRGAPTEQTVDLPTGSRIALRPPICREFIAWEGDEVRRRWLDRAVAEDRPRLRDALDAVAARGFSVERVTDEHRAVIDALATMSSVPEPLRRRVGALVSELTAVDYLPDELSGEVGAVTVGAPVFEGGRVSASIVACPNATMPADELARIGAATVAAAGQLSTAPG